LDETLTPNVHRVPVRGIELSVREWPGKELPFLLVHGLASNARTWDLVAVHLAATGHRVIAVDQRGHGLSDKPETGYSFDHVTADLRDLIAALALEQPVLAGQSWGGNVVLDFASRWPELISGLVLVDGGFIDLSQEEDATWERISVDLKPPPLAGTPYVTMRERMRAYYNDWSEEAIDMSMANYERLPDGTIRPWLSLERHMEILRALWEQRPARLYPLVTTPTLIAVADTPIGGRRAKKQDEIARAEAGIVNARVRWFANTAHDIHCHRPVELADWLLESVADGFFGLLRLPH
jgi:pimeloyl-ACP methyl ester carboxylesterase